MWFEQHMQRLRGTAQPPLVVLDFDCTITITDVSRHTQPSVEVFGGQGRIDGLRNNLLEPLQSMAVHGVQVVVLSLNSEHRIKSFLEFVGLHRYFAHIWGKDSLRGREKGQLLREFLEEKDVGPVIFADDTGEHLASVKSHLWNASTLLVRNQVGQREGLRRWHSNRLLDMVRYELTSDEHKLGATGYQSPNTGHSYGWGGIAIVEQFYGEPCVVLMRNSWSTGTNRKNTWEVGYGGYEQGHYNIMETAQSECFEEMCGLVGFQSCSALRSDRFFDFVPSFAEANADGKFHLTRRGRLYALRVERLSRCVAVAMVVVVVLCMWSVCLPVCLCVCARACLFLF